MIWAILIGMFLAKGGGGAFPVEIFSAEARTVVREVVKDEARADESARIVKQGNKELNSAIKRVSKLAKAFKKADESHEAGLEELTPILAKLSAERTQSQQVALDRLFELRQTMTEEEWNAAFARLRE